MRPLLCLLVLTACKDDPATTAKLVDELVPADHGRELRVSGTIEGPFKVVGSGDERIVVFGLTRKDKHLRVMATGVLPDLFREHNDGAARGRWLDAGEARPILTARGITGEDEIFDARDVTAQIPSFP